MYDIFGDDPQAEQEALAKAGAGRPQDPGMPSPETSDRPVYGPTGSQSAALPAMQGLTMGWGDEALAGILAAYGTFMPELAGGLPDDPNMPVMEQLQRNYEGIRDQIRTDTDAYAEDNEITSALAEGAGAIATGGAGLARAGGSGLAKAAAQRGFKPDMDTVKRLMQNIGIGGAEGAVYGAGKAEDMESIPEDAVEGALWGMAGGGFGGEAMHQGRRLFQKNSELKDELVRKLSSKSPDSSTAMVKLEQDMFGRDRIVDNPLAIEAVAQGMDPGVVPSIQRASPLDKTQMRKMTKLAHDILLDREKGQRLRPTDVVGDSLDRRFNIVLKANENAAKQLDKVAKNLKGKSVDFSPAVAQFQNDLADMGVRLERNAQGKIVPNFSPDGRPSSIAGVTPAERIIKDVVNRMDGGYKVDAYDVHNMKKFIDEHVAWGKSGEGLSGKTLGVLKRLRGSLNESLGKQFDDYRYVNSTYSETIDILDDLQNIAGKQINLTGRRGKEAMGHELRGIMSNRKSRNRLINTIDDMESLAEKYAGRQQDNLFRLALFADELDTMFPVVARTSMAGEQRKVAEQASRGAAGARDIVIEKGADLLEDYQGINNENAIKAIYKLIEDQ